MTVPLKLVLAHALTEIKDEDVAAAIKASKALANDLIDRVSESAQILSKWVQNYGDSIGLSAKQIITTEQIIQASQANNQSLKSVSFMRDLSDDVQKQVMAREEEADKATLKSSQTFGL